MKLIKYCTLAIGVVLAILYFSFFSLNESEAEAQTVAPSIKTTSISCVVNPAVVVPNVQRLGINMSFRTYYGAEQYMKNLLLNPGFEGLIERIAVIVEQKDDKSFSDNQKGLGQEDGFWKGSEFEVLSGASVGTRGIISNSLNAGVGELPQYFPEGGMPSLEKNDVIVITKISEPKVPSTWSPSSAEHVSVDCNNPRPGSSGTCSVKVEAGTELNFYLDTTQGSAGNLLTLEGQWNLTFWAKGDEDADKVFVKFARLSPISPFINQNVALSSSWQEISLNFNPIDNGTPAAIKFELANYNDKGNIWIDDVQLSPIQASNPTTAWRQDVINMLKELNPSYLRDWQVQSADNGPNRISDQFNRKCVGFRYFGGPPSIGYNYSIPEFLDLCTNVGANPWIIIPTALDDSDLDAVATYLGQHADSAKFSDVIIEIGDENWNYLFRSEQVPPIEALAPVADRAFDRIKASAGPNIHLTRIMGGQARAPHVTIQYATAIKNLDKISVAGYFFDEINASTPQSEVISNMFKSEVDYYSQSIQGSPKNLGFSLYETNLGTVSGNASKEERNPYIAGAISGTALAKAIIDTLQFNPNPNMIFCFAQYEANLPGSSGNVKLWGICRDCSTTKRWRPTGLAVKMLNKVFGGSYHHLALSPPQSGSLPAEANNLTLAAFRTSNQWSAAIVSANPTPVNLTVQFPDDGLEVPATIDILHYANSFLDTNEEAENVKIISQALKVEQRNVSFTIPAYGFVVLTNPLKFADRSSNERNDTLKFVEADF